MLDELTSSILELAELTEIKLNNNIFENLPREIVLMKQLKTLYLGNNSIKEIKGIKN